MSNTINRKKLDALKEKLSALPPREADHLKTSEAVSELADIFRTLLEQNYSIEELWDMFKRDTGSEISASTFRGYLNKALAALKAADVAKTSRKPNRVRKPAKVQRANDTDADAPEDVAGDDAGRDRAAKQQTPAPVADTSADQDEIAHNAISVP